MGERSMKWLLPVLLLLASTVAADHNWEQRDIVAGQSLYADNCASCYGANLEGQPNWQSPNADGVLPAPPHDRTGHTWHHDDELLFEYTKLGGAAALEVRGGTGFNSGMPAFNETLTDDDVWDILAYIRSTWPEREREAQASRNPQH
ncbi:c-type cytochrome [Sulfitobacter mediterraneus]|jgi:mono/diheme cytochrome c family protein|uniref:c-type cytochrome n=1 Tax=Sulfitobacter mediterraneus TaxID=83219 RepID=UPI0021A562DE|nr:cytochrome c [Sulfitobacter mediterraneus]